MTKRIVIFRILLTIYLIALIYLLSANMGTHPKFPKMIMGVEGDKFVHFCLFFPFPMLVMPSRREMSHEFWQCSITMIEIFLMGCGLAGLTEMMQDLIPYRKGDWADMRFDVYALAISSLLTNFTILSLPGNRKKRQKK